LYAWMDEGFASYADNRVSSYLNNSHNFPYAGAYLGYYSLVKSGKEEPLSTHADHYNTNFAYGNAVYSKGEVFLEQLSYIVGASVRDKILLEYYWKWRFKHPNGSDFIRIAEKVSGMKLDWYKNYWIYSNKTIDYAIDSLWQEGNKTMIRLSRVGLMPMPIDLQLTFKDSTKEIHYIPLDLMYGEKPIEDSTIPRITYDSWKWTNPTYTIVSNHKLKDITIVEIDPSQRMADIDRKNNKLELNW